jgi:hydrogenase-1 operon protein HyaF
MKDYKDFPIPIVAFGPGSQPDAEEANFLPMPSAMETFSMPVVHLEADPEILSAACDILERLRNAMLASPVNGPGRPRIELGGETADVVNLLNQSLGHGEVSIMVREPVVCRIQETVFAGVWRVQELSAQGLLLHDVLVAGSIPYVAQQSADLAAGTNVKAPPLRDGMMNAPAVLNELQDRSRSYRMGMPAHVINLSLLPMSPEDLEYLGEALGLGPVSILSRGYGNCRITSTRLAHVWWVQYFNSMDQIILNTLEVVDVPEVAQAAAEDYADSIERLGEWLDAMREEVV